MRGIAALAAFTMLGFAGVAEAERLAVPPITAPAELADEAGSIELLVKSSLAKGKLTLVEVTPDRTATAELSRAATGLELDVVIVAHDGTRETAAIIAGDGDIVALATGMVDKIGAVTQTTPQPVRPFALGQLRPYAAALRVAKADPAAAIAILADAAPAVAIGLPAIALAFADLVAAAPTPTARLVVARAIGATDVVATIGAGKDSIASAARAFAAIDRADLATAETELVNVSGGLAALGHAAIAAEHDDIRLGGMLQEALQSDQRRSALALASTIVPAHVSPSVHRALLPLAERAAAISPGVASRIGFAAAQAKVEPARSLALVSVRELDQFAVDALGAILEAQKDLPKPTLLRLRAELAMRKHEGRAPTLVDAYLAAAPTEPRAQQYAAWSKLPAKRTPGEAVTVAPTGASDEDFVHQVNEPRSGAIDLVLPIVAGVGVLVLVTLLLLRRRKRSAPVVAPAPAPRARAMAGAKLKIDMTTPPIAIAASSDNAAVDLPKTSLSRALPPSSTQAELGDRLQGFIDVELPAAAPPAVAPRPRPQPAAATFADADPLGEVAASPPPRKKRESTGVSPAIDVELGAPDLMPLGSDPKLQFPSGSRPSQDVSDFALDAPGPRIDIEHANLVKPGTRPEGKSLAAMLAERGALPWLEAVGLIDQICAGLAHAHAHGVVHGGVQPATIYVAGRVARLGDFHIVNKPPYAPPDRSGAPADDLYAIGTTLGEMLGAGDAPPRLAELVAALRWPTAAGRPPSIADVRTAFKALFDF